MTQEQLIIALVSAVVGWILRHFNVITLPNSTPPAPAPATPPLTVGHGAILDAFFKALAAFMASQPKL